MQEKTREAGKDSGKVEEAQQVEASGDAILIADGLYGIAEAIRELAASIRQHTDAISEEVNLDYIPDKFL